MDKMILLLFINLKLIYRSFHYRGNDIAEECDDHRDDNGMSLLLFLGNQ